MKNSTIVGLLVLLVLLCGVFLSGFFLGKKGVVIPEPTVVTVTDTSYIPGDVVYDTVMKPEPYAVIDTVKVPANTDTAALMKDYFLIKKYALDFSNDTLGIFKIGAEVTQNTLEILTTEIQPLIKTITIKETTHLKRKYKFFGTFGSSFDLNTNKIQGGAILNEKWIIGVSGVRIKKELGYTIDLGLQF